MYCYLYGVQGVVSSNPTAPTSNTKGFRLIFGNPFSFLIERSESAPYIAPYTEVRYYFGGYLSPPRPTTCAYLESLLFSAGVHLGASGDSQQAI